MKRPPAMDSQIEHRTVAGVPIQVLTVTPSPDPGRTILMIHENRGMVPYMVAVAHELAAEGYRVVAPDLLSRIGGTAKYADDPQAVSTRQVDSATHVADLIAVFDALAEGGKVPAVVGFCFGAEMGWQLITRRTPLGAVLYYGIGPSAADTREIATPVYAAYAEDDPRVNDTFDTMADALIEAGCRFVAESYPGTRHAFHDRSRPERFHPAAADFVWRRTLGFLDQLFDTR